MNPTQDLSFWRGRIQQAKENNRPIDDAMAVGFDWDIIDPEHKRILEEAGVAPDSKILDVGCGYGRVAGWFKDGSYVGVDLVPEFVDEARKRHPGKTFEVMDITKPLPFKDNEFDVGLLLSVKRGVVEPVVGPEVWAATEAELKRVCKKLVILSYGASRVADIRADMEIFNKL